MTADHDLLPELLLQSNLALTPERIRQLNWLGEELLRWNRSRNLTAIRTWPDIVEKHLVDSLRLLPHVPDTGRLLDIGSGAGFPSLPLKIARPDLVIVSVDAVAKKIFFQRHVARKLELKRFIAVHGRMEDWQTEPALAEPFNLATARAVADLGHLAELAAPCLHPGGSLLAMKGPEGTTELEAHRQKLVASGWRGRVECGKLPGSGATRSLVILEKAEMG